MGKFVKLLGKTAVLVDAIAEAFRIANGFLPVKLVYPWLPSIFEAPFDVLSLRLPADFAASPYTPAATLSEPVCFSVPLSVPRSFLVTRALLDMFGSLRASPLNCSML